MSPSRSSAAKTLGAIAMVCGLVGAAILARPQILWHIEDDGVRRRVFAILVEIGVPAALFAGLAAVAVDARNWWARTGLMVAIVAGVWLYWAAGVHM